MATYNGEKYISEQIDSILEQTYQDFRIIIRDDGSTDKTVEIIEDYAKKYPEKIKIIHDDVICRHPTKNFFELMKYAQADYIMFSDQDDYWLPHKIQISLYYMKKTENENPGKPVLVFGELFPVDENLTNNSGYFNTRIRHTKQYKNFSVLLMFNSISGCVMTINRTLLENIGEYSEAINFHDHWAALIARAWGEICYLPMMFVLHRQHKKNVTAHLDNKYNVIKSLFRDVYISLLARQEFTGQKERYILFRERYSQYLNSENLEQLDNYLKLFDKNIFTRFKAFAKLNAITKFRFNKKLRWLINILLYC